METGAVTHTVECFFQNPLTFDLLQSSVPPNPLEFPSMSRRGCCQFPLPWFLPTGAVYWGWFVLRSWEETTQEVWRKKNGYVFGYQPLPALLGLTSLEWGSLFPSARRMATCKFGMYTFSKMICRGMAKKSQNLSRMAGNWLLNFFNLFKRVAMMWRSGGSINSAGCLPNGVNSYENFRYLTVRDTQELTFGGPFFGDSFDCINFIVRFFIFSCSPHIISCTLSRLPALLCLILSYHGRWSHPAKELPVLVRSIWSHQVFPLLRLLFY